jgi:P27 family predicted phage terminase small subunit
MPNPRVPAALNIFNGNPGKRKPRKPLNLAGKPSCPAWLDEYAKSLWKRIAPQYERLGLLLAPDEPAFAALCQAYAELKIATEDVKKNGRVREVPIQTRDGDIIGYDRKPNPAVKQQQAATEMLRKLAMEFGMTAVSRAKLETTGDKEDDLEDFLRSG